MVKAMDSRIIVIDFVLQSRYYVSLSGKYPWERYEHPYPPSYWLNSTTIYEGESKSNGFFFIIGIITDTGTCIIHRNKAGPMWITFLLLNIVTVSPNSNVPPSNENMYP